MDRGSQRIGGRTSPGRRNVQPRDSADLGELVEFEADRRARHLERLAADQDLLTTLELTGFAGPDWERFAAALVEYGYQVIGAWLRSGKIFTECKKKGRARPTMAMPIGEFAPQDVEDLTEDTVATAVVKFRENVLMKHKWTMHGGASLKTYFIGHCLLRFPDVFDSWRIASRQATRVDRALRSEPPSAPASRVDDLLADIDDPFIREVARLTAEGWHQDEIAETLGVTAGALEGRLYRFRKTKKSA